MTLIETVAVAVAAVASVIAYLSHRRVNKAYEDTSETINWLLNKLEKSRYDARKEYEETGWAPGSDKPDSH